MSSMKIIINTPEDMIALGEKIGSLLQANMILALEGDLGAGKTTLTKGIAKALGIKRVINSPTFTIMKIYDEGKLPLYHLDVYRLNNDSGDEDLEEYLHQGGVSVIEWASNFSNLLSDEYLLVSIHTLENDVREVTLTSDALKYQAIIEGLQ